MKKVLLAAVISLGLSTLGGVKVQAQTKIGYINSEELMSVMPEFKKADSSMQLYQRDLQKAKEDIQNELQEKQAKFIKDSATMTQAKKDIERRSLNDLYGRFVNYDDDASQQYRAKYQEVLAPIQKKALETIQTVAKENGYTFVIEKQAAIVAPPTDDLLPLVKKKLGLK